MSSINCFVHEMPENSESACHNFGQFYSTNSPKPQDKQFAVIYVTRKKRKFLTPESWNKTIFVLEK